MEEALKGIFLAMIQVADWKLQRMGSELDSCGLEISN
jgi:hypothetical protein